MNELKEIKEIILDEELVQPISKDTVNKPFDEQKTIRQVSKLNQRLGILDKRAQSHQKKRDNLISEIDSLETLLKDKDIKKLR